MMLNLKKSQGNVQEPGSGQAFWVDDEPINVYLDSNIKRFTSIFQIYRLITSYAALIVLCYIIWRISPILFTIVFVIILLAIPNGLILRKRQRALTEEKKQIQLRARQTTGAEVIGSAVHVAGHPLFERDQPVVLALKSDELSIHTYQSQVPVDVIRMDEIKAIHTVVYDDERVPHIDVIDSAAQALQVTVTLNGKEYTCLFRRLRKVRVIDWYHAIQKAKAL